MSISPFVAETAVRNRGRIPAIDAARGAAMILVCLSHFGTAYMREDAPKGIELFFAASMVASPTFIFISGMMLGLLYDRSRRRFGPTRVELIDRALFLLTIAHIALIGGVAARVQTLNVLSHQTFITDGIAISLFVGAMLVDRIESAQRVLIGLVLYATNCVLVFFWSGLHGGAHEAKMLLVGLDPSQPMVAIFPLLPWFAMYVIGSAVGEHMSQLMQRGEVKRMQASFGIAGAVSIALALGAKMLAWYEWGRARPNLHLAAPLAYFVSSPWQKYPPGPIYLLFFGGAALLMIAILFVLMTRAWFSPFARLLMLFGRCSLFLFVIQYYLYFGIIWTLHLSYRPWWPLIFAASVIALFPAACWWDSRRGNRYLTVGTRQILTRLQAISLRAGRSVG